MISMYYLVEHPVRGVYIGNYDGKYKFSCTIKKSRGLHFPTFSAAYQVSARVSGAYILRVTTNYTPIKIERCGGESVYGT
jgi:hypothetical protein